MCTLFHVGLQTARACKIKSIQSIQEHTIELDELCRSYSKYTYLSSKIALLAALTRRDSRVREYQITHPGLISRSDCTSA